MWSPFTWQSKTKGTKVKSYQLTIHKINKIKKKKVLPKQKYIKDSEILGKFLVKWDFVWRLFWDKKRSRECLCLANFVPSFFFFIAHLNEGWLALLRWSNVKVQRGKNEIYPGSLLVLSLMWVFLVKHTKMLVLSLVQVFLINFW